MTLPLLTLIIAFLNGDKEGIDSPDGAISRNVFRKSLAAHLFSLALMIISSNSDKLL